MESRQHLLLFPQTRGEVNNLMVVWGTFVIVHMHNQWLALAYGQKIWNTFPALLGELWSQLIRRQRAMAKYMKIAGDGL
jgi:hypothetical protein